MARIYRSRGDVRLKVAPRFSVDLADTGQLAVGVAGLVNWKFANTRQIAAAYLGAQAGDLSSRVVVAMDSVAAGTGSTNNGLVNARSKSWPRLLAQQLSAMGVVAYDTWAGGSGHNGNDLPTYLGYDPRVAFGSSSGLNVVWRGFAGPAWQLGSDTVNGWVDLTPLDSFDTVDILHHIAPGTGVFRMLDQAGVQAGANINTNPGGQGVAETTITFPAGSTKARAVWVSTNTVLLSGMGTRIASKRGIEILNVSMSGILTDWYTMPPGGNEWAAYQACLPVVFGARTAGRHVAILGGGYNDIYVGGATLATVQARLRSRVNTLRALPNAPDIIVMGYPQLGAQTEAARAELNEAVRRVTVEEFDLPFVDLRQITEPTSSSIAKGFMSTDTLHMRAAYQALTARTFCDGFQFSASMSA